MTATDHDSPWLMPLSNTMATGRWDSQKSHITNGSDLIPDIIMGDVEGTHSDSHIEDFHSAAQHSQTYPYHYNIDPLHTQAYTSPENEGTPHHHIPGNWEELNTQIRQRNKPPKLPRSAKFTRSSVTIASQNINGRDKNKSITSAGHKFTYMKRMMDEKRIGILALQETHMNDIAASQFENIYRKWFKLFNSGHPIKPDSTAGVSFVLNKKYACGSMTAKERLMQGCCHACTNLGSWNMFVVKFNPIWLNETS
jgi:hypothetical protein